MSWHGLHSDVPLRHDKAGRRRQAKKDESGDQQAGGAGSQKPESLAVVFLSVLVLLRSSPTSTEKNWPAQAGRRTPP
jgi:hypothetical protein